MPQHPGRLREPRRQAGPIREFALGLEALDRFIRREPLQRARQCILAVLALESKLVDRRR